MNQQHAHPHASDQTVENIKKLDQPIGNLQKDPDDWVTGDEPMTAAQASYLKTLCEEAGEEFESGLTKAEASKHIEALQQQTGRGVKESATSWLHGPNKQRPIGARAKDAPPE